MECYSESLGELICLIRRDLERVFMPDDKGEEYEYARHHSLRLCGQITWTDSPGYPFTYQEKSRACVVALLHDVVEMTEYSVDDLRKRYESMEEFSEFFEKEDFDEIFSALAVLRRWSLETYSEYIDRVKCDKLAAIVKVYDITDNIRTCFRTGTRKSLIDRYTKALKTLSKTFFVEGQAEIFFELD